MNLDDRFDELLKRLDAAAKDSSSLQREEIYKHYSRHSLAYWLERAHKIGDMPFPKAAALAAYLGVNDPITRFVRDEFDGISNLSELNDRAETWLPCLNRELKRIGRGRIASMLGKRSRNSRDLRLTKAILLAADISRITSCNGPLSRHPDHLSQSGWVTRYAFDNKPQNERFSEYMDAHVSARMTQISIQDCPGAAWSILPVFLAKESRVLTSATDCLPSDYDVFIQRTLRNFRKAKSSRVRPNDGPDRRILVMPASGLLRSPFSMLTPFERRRLANHLNCERLVELNQSIAAEEQMTSVSEGFFRLPNCEWWLLPDQLYHGLKERISLELLGRKGWSTIVVIDDHYAIVNWGSFTAVNVMQPYVGQFAKQINNIVREQVSNLAGHHGNSERRLMPRLWGDIAKAIGHGTWRLCERCRGLTECECAKK